MILLSIQQNITALRNLYDVTQSELAEIAGVTRAAVSQWESGFSEPRLKAIQAMADHFGIRKYNIIEDGGMDNIDPATGKPVMEFYDEVGVYDGLELGKTVESVPPAYSFYCPHSIKVKHPEAVFVELDHETCGELPSGCLALVDLDQNDAVEGELYAVWKDWEDETWDNWAVVERAYRQGFPDTWHVIGRVVWYSSKLPYAAPAPNVGTGVSADEKELLGSYRRMDGDKKEIMLKISRVLDGTSGR